MVGARSKAGFDPGWFAAWLLILLTLLPLRALVTWSQGRLAIGAGGLLKQRLLFGALSLKPEAVRQHGAGHFLGLVNESEAVESLALNGGFLGLVAIIELVLAGVVLGAGAGNGLHVVLLVCWTILTGCLGWWYYRRRRRWTTARLDMTHDLVEQMVGHRTRLAQQLPETRHAGEDQVLARYLTLSGGLDRVASLGTLLPRGWLIVGLLGLAPAFVAGQSSPAMLAISVGGILLAFEAFRKLEAGLQELAGASVAWEQVAPLFEAGRRSTSAHRPPLNVSARSESESNEPIIEAHGIEFGYNSHQKPVLRNFDLQVCAGERLLLEGASGSGKSTLAALLTGLRSPRAGQMLLYGLDQQTLGTETWRRKLVSAPQFHENHVLTETFAFNLLMGRAWPPRPEDLAEAEEICRELGLDDLLDRMPAGMQQMVGETGWQLSHGEQSRLFVARALLQQADLIVLDESFAALDPENLEQALRCVLRRAKTLMVIAHP